MNRSLMMLFILLTVQTTGIAQQDAAYKNQLKISPFRLLDPVHSGIEISYERRYAPQYSMQLSATYFIENIFSRVYDNYKGYRIGIEEKYFLPRRSRNIYISAEAVYQRNSYNTVDRFTHDSTLTSPSFEYIDSIKIKRRAAIINSRIGRQFIVSRFTADISIGVGIRIRKVIHEGKIYPGDKTIGPRHPNIHYEANREKNDVAFNLPLNFRIGFSF